MEIIAKSTASKGNVKLWERYREAWERIKRALDQEFYFEAIAIEESILSNRVISFLRGKKRLTDKQASGEEYVPFGKLITLWKKADEDGLVLKDTTALIGKLGPWAERRNRAVHAIAKSFPGQPPKIGLDEFLAEAKGTAQEGKSLARAVENWHKRQLRRDQKTQMLTPIAAI